MDRREFLQAGVLTALVPAAQSRAANHARNRVSGYRRLGRTGFEISDISFGSSRLRSGQERLVEHALERGINYFDSADSYTGGSSEQVLGKALTGKRDKVYLVSKTMARADASVSELMGDLEDSLARLNTDYVDVYLNHAVNDVDRLRNPAWGEFIERAKAQGKVRATGMSGHAGRLIECLDYAIDNNLADVILVAYNFGQDPAFYEQFARSFDYIARQPELPRVLEKAHKNDVGVVAMKTLMGARLNDMRPYEADGATYAQAAFRWVLANQNVDALVISMTEEALIDEYIGASGASAVSVSDVQLLRQYARLNGTSYCRHACNDCEGACPFGVPIADVLRTRMYATDYRDLAFARAEYQALEVNAAACLGCSGTPCQDACSHGLPIAGMCAPAHQILS